jgi:hypothetical protein
MRDKERIARQMNTSNKLHSTQRYSIVAAAIIGSAVLAATAFATGVFRRGSGTPVLRGSPVGALPAEAQRLFSAPTSWGQRVSAWNAISSGGYRCTLFQVDDASAQSSFKGTAGGTCKPASAPPPTGAPIGVRMSSVTLPDGSSRLMLFGTVWAGSGISQVELASASGTDQLLFRGGAFAGELRADKDTGLLTADGGPYVVVGRDAAGNKIAEVNLNRVNELATAHP